MCSCTSCKYTDGFAGGLDLIERLGSAKERRERMRWHLETRQKAGFENWPRGDPAGPGSSARAYAMHQTQCPPIAKHVQFKPGRVPQYPAWTRGNGPVTPAPKYVLDWINRKEASPALAEPARPAQACKPEQHFPERDRVPETAVIYAMPKSQPVKRPVGRPPIGRRVVVNLEEHHIKRAIELGGGERGMSAGIRKALERKQRL